MNSDIDYLIDSSVIKSYTDGNSKAMELIYSGIDGNISLAISSYTLYKVWGTDSFDRRSEIGYSGLLKFLKVINVDSEIAKIAGHIARLLKESQVSEFNDFFDEHAIAGSIVKGRECVAVTDSEVLIDEPEVRFVSLDSVELY